MNTTRSRGVYNMVGTRGAMDDTVLYKYPLIL